MTILPSPVTSTVRRLNGFNDPGIPRELWATLLRKGNTQTIFQTREWLEPWWESFGRGEMIMLLVEWGGQPRTVAPLFEDSGMVYLIGSGGSDYLDLIGHCDVPTLRSVIEFVSKELPEVEGIIFYHLRDDSSTGSCLRTAAAEMGIQCIVEAALPAPYLGLSDPDIVQRAVKKKSLVRHSNYLRRHGSLGVDHLVDCADILACLEAFFDQHISRWAETSSPSLFNEPGQQEFYRRLTHRLSESGYLILTRISWNGHPVAFHFGFSFQGTFMWYKPSFDSSLSRRSPGEVLLRELLLYAHASGHDLFDFGLGDEPFKDRFATGKGCVSNWSLCQTVENPLA